MLSSKVLDRFKLLKMMKSEGSGFDNEEEERLCNGTLSEQLKKFNKMSGNVIMESDNESEIDDTDFVYGSSEYAL